MVNSEFIGGLESVQMLSQLEMLRKAVAGLRKEGDTVALVPTMGALHDGHLSLVRRAKELADSVVVSIFVNPTQFGPGEDLAAYPRTLEEDSRLLEAEGVDLLWAPKITVMYPERYATSISVSGVSEGFCGADRPGHFDGVATVVCKLFHQVRPDIACFGEKDWQQLVVIRRMTRDLNLSYPDAANIIGVPTVREADGLAMSSRNRYLTPDQRQAAATLPQAMKAAIAKLESGEEPVEALAQIKTKLIDVGFDSVDYVELADADSLEVLKAGATRPARLLVAARIGGTRLIDNMAYYPPI